MTGRYKAYPEYKESGVDWLSIIPKQWDCKKLKFFLSEMVRGPFGSALKKEYFSTKGIKVYEQKNCIQNDISIGDSYISAAIYQELQRFTVKENDLLMSCSGTIGKIVEVPEQFEKGIINQALLIMRIDNTVIDQTFFKHVFRSEDIQKQIKDNSQGGAMQNLVATEIFKSISFTIPSFEEQKKIANFLDHETAKIDTLIAKQEKLIELLKEKRQAVISHAVTRGLNPDAPLKDSGVEWLGEVPAHWEIKKLKHIVKEPLLYGANEAAEDADKSQPRFVRITDVKADGTLKDDTFRSLPESVAIPYMLYDGDILLARSGGTVGKSFIYRGSWGRCCFAGYLIKASINEDIIDANWVYFNTLTNFYWDWIKSSQIQATIQNVSADKYNSFEIAIPPENEVRDILSYLQISLERFDCLTVKAEQAIELMKELKTAIISAAVTGKIDVRDWDK